MPESQLILQKSFIISVLNALLVSSLVFSLRFFDNPLSKYLIFKFLACIGCFELFVKRGVSTFWCTFSAYFFHINVPYLIPYQLTKFQYQTQFPSQNIKQYIFLNSYQIDNVMTLEFIFNHLLKLWLTEGNKGHQGNPKI